MANLNVNIAKKLISYVRHGCDINDEIKEVYKNSLIFIGDENQIYVPAMDTYVGIGLTAYNETIDRISTVENDVNNLANIISTDLVSKIYANYSLDELSGENGHASVKSNSDEALQLKNRLKANGKDHWALSNDITLKGIGNYDPETGFARRNVLNHQYELNLPESVGTNETFTVTNSQYYEENALPTSGITVTPHWGDFARVENPVTHEKIEKRLGNYITIDDSLTWSYMTSAYAYTMNFAKKYTANEIDRLYHNLLGDYKATYLPVAFNSVIDDFTPIIQALSNDEREHYNETNPNSYLITVDNGNDTYTYYVVDISKQHNVSDVTYSGVFIGTYSSTYTTKETVPQEVITSNVVYSELTLDELYGLIPNGTNDDSIVLYENSTFPQLYVLDSQYDSTYNMNIADGINTLKEVAYLLDKLSDGSLGTTTYLTWADLKTQEDSLESGATWQNGSSYTVNDVQYPITIIYPGVITAGDQIIWGDTAPRDDELVAFYTVEGDQENLGIQIAYSIAGNKVEIDDLHKHAKLLEEGKTTLRSIQSTSTEFATVSLIGGTKDWVDTDSAQGKNSFNNTSHPNYNYDGSEYEVNVRPSYLVGDVNIKVALNAATVYATSYSADNAEIVNAKYIDKFGVTWYGTYTAADMNALTVDGTYYKMVTADYESHSETPRFVKFGTSYGDNPLDDLTGVNSTPIIEPRNQPAGLQYYWIPGGASAKNNNEQNLKLEKISKEDLIALSWDELLPYSDFTKRNYAGKFYAWNESSSTYDPIDVLDANQPSAYNAINNTTYSTFYYLIGYEQTSIHAIIDGNKVATTEWVGAHVDETVNKITDDIKNTLDQAKKYTDDKINSLDNEYIYSDFPSYWSTFQTLVASESETSILVGGVSYLCADLLQEGSKPYTYVYNKFYEEYIARGNNYVTVNGIDAASDVYDAETNDYRLSYKSNSQYTYNIIEENGIVTAAARELPTDELEANVEFWGDDTNIHAGKHQYADVVLENQPKGSYLFTALYNWAANNGDTQLFVREFDANTTYTFVPVSVNSGVHNIYAEYPSYVNGPQNEGTFYEIYNNSFTELNSDHHILPQITSSNYDYANQNDKRWFRLYQKSYVYTELDLHEAEEVIESGSLNVNKLTIGDYLLVKDGNYINVTKNNVSCGRLLYINVKADSSTKYFTVENKHYSYVNNGLGENKVNVTAHITRIEDATKTNTGFADAYDVQSYLENYFNFIDISASVSETRLNHSDDFYRMITLDEYNAINSAYIKQNNNQLTEEELSALPKYAVDFNHNVIVPDLYTRSDASNNPQASGYLINYTKLNDNYTTKFFWKDDNSILNNDEYLTLEDAESAAVALVSANPSIHVPINGKYIYEQFAASNDTPIYHPDFPSDCNYYVRKEEPRVNPRNLTETKYGEVPER